MKNSFIALILILSLPSVSRAEDLNPFETDYCTNYPEGTFHKPDLWKHCCLQHDMYFWAGGSAKDRDAADLELKACIDKTGAKKQAIIMYYAVRAGSYSPYKYPKYRWNNGWPLRIDPSPLSEDDIFRIETELNNGYEFIPQDLKIYFIDSLRQRP